MAEPSFCTLEKESSFNLLALLSVLRLMLRDVRQTGQVFADDVEQMEEVLDFWIRSFCELPMDEDQIAEMKAHLLENQIMLSVDENGMVSVGHIQH